MLTLNVLLKLAIRYCLELLPRQVMLPIDILFIQCNKIIWEQYIHKKCLFFLFAGRNLISEWFPLNVLLKLAIRYCLEASDVAHRHFVYTV